MPSSQVFANTGTTNVNLNFRASPNGRDLGTNIRPGETFKIIDSKSSWVKIQRSNGRTGWVFKKYVKTTSTSSPAQAAAPASFEATNVVTAGSLNIRTGPNKRVIGSVKDGDKIQVLKNHGSWSEIRTESGLKGFAFNQYLEPIPKTELPVLALNEEEKEETAPAVTAIEKAIESAPESEADRIAKAVGEQPPAAIPAAVAEPSPPQEIKEPKTKDDEVEATCDDCGIPKDQGPNRDVWTFPDAVIDYHRREQAQPGQEGTDLTVKEKQYTSILRGNCQIGSPYGMRRHPILGYMKMHTGQDIKRPPGGSINGEPIRAPADGKIIGAGWAGGYGKQVKLSLKNGIVISLNHLSKYGKKGTVKAGDIIGYVGTTGLSTGPHLHLEATINGKRINPKSLFTNNDMCGVYNVEKIKK